MHPLTGFASAATSRIPRPVFLRWKEILRIKGGTVQDRLVELIGADVKENWSEELEQAFRDVYGLEG